jgi:hypothetical protein
MSSTPPDPPDPQHWTSPFEELLGETVVTPGGPGTGDTHRADPVFGTPGTDTAFWDGPQKYSHDCAIKCQQFILQQFSGQRVDEDYLVREATEHGWYSPGVGTPPQDVGKLLELHGVDVTRYEHASQFHLATELAQGHKVIVGVESGRLSHHDPILDGLRDLLGIHGAADHAVVVSGIDTTDPHHVLVQVSDPGTGDPLATYPLEQFLDAWKGSDFSMVATRDPAPAHLPEMAHFDYALGHIPAIADLPYEEFLEYGPHPGALEEVVHHYAEVHHEGGAHHHLDDLAAADHDLGNYGSLHPTDDHPDLPADHHSMDGTHGHPDPMGSHHDAHAPFDRTDTPGLTDDDQAFSAHHHPGDHVPYDPV